VTTYQPLAHRMRPQKIEDVIGQKHLLGENKPLYRMIKNHRLSSMILFGPPGVGKTTIASAIAGSILMPFRALNGVTDGKKEIEAVIKEAKKEETTYLLYIDEIHRLTKTQSEPLLPAIENGTIVLISSTTESVYHSLPSGILSRCTVYELNPLETEDIVEGLNRALDHKENGLGEYNVHFEDKVLTHLAETTGGDMRSALNALETVVITNSEAGEKETKEITMEMVEEVTNKKNLGFNGNDTKYDLMSSFQKSIRGSDVNAALYYLALMLENGDLVTICRRLSVIAFEDISIADPSTWSATMAAVECAERVGLPEGRIPLANAVTLLCLSPKSNSAYSALDAAIADIRNGNVHPIPRHLRDAHYAGAANRGNGVDYKYPHNYHVGSFGSFVPQQYLPDALKGREYYQPKEAGKEKQLAEIYRKLKEIQNKK